MDPARTHIKFWCRAAIDKTDVKLDTGGEHRRDFTYIEDTAKGIVAVYLAETCHQMYIILVVGNPICCQR